MRNVLTGVLLAGAVSAQAQTIVAPPPGPVPDMGCQVQGLDPKGDGFLAVRSGPGTTYAQIGSLRNGDAAFVAAQPSGRWVYVENGVINGREADFRGWIYDAWCLFYP